MRRTSIAIALLLAACADAPPPPPEAPPPPPPAPTATASARALEAPPPPGAPVAFRLPEARWSTLANGVSLGLVTVRGLPIVEARVSIRGGRAAEGDRPGVSEVLAELLKEAADPGALGGRLSIDAGDDAITLQVSMTSDALAPALARVGAALRAPKLGAAEVKRVAKRLAGDAADRAAEEGLDNAEQAMRRALFPAGHPYARTGALAEDFARVSPADVTSYHARVVAGPSVTVVLVGDLDPEGARAAAEKALAGLRPKAAPLAALPKVEPPAARRVVIAHRPKSERSDIFVAYLAPKAADADAPAFELVQAVLGHKGAGRLFMTVRETQSLVYHVLTSTEDHEIGPAIGAVMADTQAPKTARAVEGILAELSKVTREPAPEDELMRMRRIVAASLAGRVQRVGDIAGEILRLRRLSLPADHREGRDRAIAALSPEAVRAAAERALRPGREVIAVAGDAEVIAEDLRRFGAVEIVDPTRGFALVKRLEARAP